MEEIEVDPWIKMKIDAYDVYSVLGEVLSIPFVITEDLTLRKSREKFIRECRTIPRNATKLIDEKPIQSLEMDPPLNLDNKLKFYQKGSSSQHMSTILDVIDSAGYGVEGVDVLVASDTLHKIAGAVFQQHVSWRLRAHLETIQCKKVIVLCDDDLEEIELIPSRSRFSSERADSLNFAQGWSKRDDNDSGDPEKRRVTNPHLHGSRLVLATIKHRDSVVNMAVVGEVDIFAGKQSINTAVMTGRSLRVNLGGDDESILKSFEYLWSRCFWIGLTSCLIGMRSEYRDPVKSVHRFDLREYYRTSRKRFDSLPDVAINCVAQVMNRLKEAVDSTPHANWIVEYQGRPEELEPNFIKISMASESRSFWLVREHFQIAKDFHTTRAAEKAEQMVEKKLKTKCKVDHSLQLKKSKLSRVKSDKKNFKK